MSLGPTLKWLVPVLLGVLLLIAPAAKAQMPNPYGPNINTETAKKAAEAALAEARKNNWTMAAAVVDTSGTLVYFERIDNTQNGSSVVAIDKARSAALFKRPTKALQDAVAAGGEGLRDLCRSRAASLSSPTARSLAPSASPAEPVRRTANAPKLAPIQLSSFNELME